MNEILLEYYQGKPKELLKCEEYLRHIIKDINDDHNKLLNLRRQRSAYRQSKWVNKLCTELADFFNIERVDIYFEIGNVNGGTIPNSAIFAPIRKYNYLHGKKSNLKIHIILFEELIYFAKLTETELLAVILHEIGHNFYFCPLLSMLTLASVVTTEPIKTLKHIVLTHLSKISTVLIDKLKTSCPMLFNAYNLYMDLMQQWLSLFIPYMQIISVILLLMGRVKIVIENGALDYKTMTYKLLRYGDEKGADSFASKYGYGPDNISALEKMSNAEGLLGTQTMASMGSVGSVWADVVSLYSDLISLIILDPHPSNFQRANSVCQKLERDLAKGEYPPEMEKDLKAEIERAHKIIDTMADPKYGGDVSVRKTWYQTLNKLTGGHTDIREAFDLYYRTRQF